MSRKALTSLPFAARSVTRRLSPPMMVAKPSNLGSSSPLTTVTARKSGKYISPFNSLFEDMKAGKTLISPENSTAQAEPARLKCGVFEHRLRFKTVNYPRLQLPPYVHPNEYKVTLKVYLNDLPLKTDLEKKIFHQIVGSRYIETFGELRLSSNQFASRIENKRHLTSMLNRIVSGAKQLAKDIEGKEGESV